MGFKVYGLVFRIDGVGSRVKVVGFSVMGLGLWV